MTTLNFEEARIAAATARKNAKAIRTKWKTAVPSTEREAEFNITMQELDTAIQRLIPFASDESVYHIDAEREIGDCHGVRGGAYRDWGKYGEAAQAYDEGLVFERRSFELGGQPNSYCLVQRLVMRVLKAPVAFEQGQLILGLNVKVELAASAQVIQQQKEVLRKRDPWAQADFALVLQLLGRDSAEAEWDKFDDMLPDRGVYDATLEVVQLLLKRLTLDETRRARWNDLEERLASK